MIALAPTRAFTVALVGNPNTGKSTLFSGLVGVHQHVGNYPGVTVEKKVGQMTLAGRRFEVIDLPGLYSLAPRSRDEMVVVDLLLGRREEAVPVDAVVCIVDASNLERNLYLVSQVLELGLPTVLALNMLDVATGRGIRIDLARFQRQLGIPIVPIQANRRTGLPRLKDVLAQLADEGGEERGEARRIRGGEGERGRGGDLRAGIGGGVSPSPPLPLSPSLLSSLPSPLCQRCRGLPGGLECLPRPPVAQHVGSSPLPEEFETEVESLDLDLAAAAAKGGEDVPVCPESPLSRSLVRRLLLDTSGYLQGTLLNDAGGHWKDRIEAARARLAAAGCPVPAVETSARYDWARRVLGGVATAPGQYRATASDRIDRVLTHRLWGTLIFAVVMVLMFQSVFVWAKPATNAIESLKGLAGDWLRLHMAEGAVRSLLADGLIGGVGMVFAFLPQILLLFGFLALLEDCGYMARAAYLMDRVMAGVGLSGKSFIPLLSSFGCAVPGIMATRVIENDRDRLTTILIAPLLTCSARLPIYTMLIAAFVPEWTYYIFGDWVLFRWWAVLTLQGLVMAALYLLGIVAAVLLALLFKRTILRGRTPPFLMELPSYKWPSPRTVLFRMTERGWVFLRCAGTLILAASILVWAALYYPHHPGATPEQQQRGSFLGRAGQVIEPAVRPLGWDWRIGCAVIASLPAREIVVATLGVMYHIDDEPAQGREGGSAAWSRKLHSVTWDGTDRPVFNLPVALSIMVFFALCVQCAATLAVIRRETNSWRWPAFTFAYMTALAYVGALATYQIGMWIGG